MVGEAGMIATAEFCDNTVKLQKKMAHSVAFHQRAERKPKRPQEGVPSS